MDEIARKVALFVKDALGYHKRFSSFQKIVIISLVVGIASIFYVHFLTVVAVYFLAVLTATVVCHVLISTETNFTFGITLLVFFRRHGVFFRDLFSALKSFGQIIWEFPNKKESRTGKHAESLENKSDVGSESSDENKQYSVVQGTNDHCKNHNDDELAIETNKKELHTKIKKIGKPNSNCTNTDKKLSGKHGKTKLKSHWKIEAITLTDYVVRDFIQPWYQTFPGAKPDIMDTSHNILHTCLLNLCKKIGNIDSYQVCTELFLLYRQHLQSFQTSRTLYKTQPRRRLSQRKLSSHQQQICSSHRINSIEDAYEIKFSYHTAVWEPENEIIYIRSTVQFLLSQLLGEHLHNCNTSLQLLVEILTCNVFLPVIELLSEPDFLLECIIQILSDEELAYLEDKGESSSSCSIDETISEEKSIVPDIDRLSERSREENFEQSEKSLDETGSKGFTHDRSKTLNKTSTNLLNVTCTSTTEEVPYDKSKKISISRSKSSQELSINSGTLEIPHSSRDTGNGDASSMMSKSLTDSRISDVNIQSVQGSESSENLEDQFGPVTVYLQESNGRTEPAAIQSHQELADSRHDEKSSGKVTPCVGDDDDDISEEITNMFVDISIVDTETTQEMRSTTQYTLYVIQYDGLFFTDNKNLVVRTRVVKRRFREFINLQARLEDNDAYKKSLKNVKGPKRWLSLPFGNMDKKSVDSRRLSLETFLKSLIQKSDISNGPELKEFLAYEGDGHIAFVRKAPEMSVPRIDKMIVRTVSGVFDKIGELSNKAQEVLPRLPGMKENSVQQQEEENRPLVDVDQINLEFVILRDQVLPVQNLMENCLKRNDEQNCPIVKKESEKTEPQDVKLQTSKHQEDVAENSDFEDLSELVNTNENMDSKTGNMKQENDKSKVPTDELTEKQTEIRKTTTLLENHAGELENDIALAEGVLDLVMQTLQGRGCWVTRDRVVNLSKRLAGTALSRFLMFEIDDLTSEDRCAVYMELLKDTVWPDGMLSTDRRAVKTDKQKEVTKEQATKCLANFFPDILRTFVGEDDYMHGVSEVIESLQHQKLNRNFIFQFLDYLLETLFPDMSLEEIKKNIGK